MNATIVAKAVPQIVALLGNFSLFTLVFSIYMCVQTGMIPIYKNVSMAGAVSVETRILWLNIRPAISLARLAALSWLLSSLHPDKVALGRLYGWRVCTAWRGTCADRDCSHANDVSN